LISTKTLLNKLPHPQLFFKPYNPKKMKKVLLVAAVALAGTTASAQKLGCGTTAKHMIEPGHKTHIGGLDTTRGRGLADNYYLWDNGATINVKFLSGSKALQEKVKKLAKVWETHANVKFNFVTSGPANVRVKLGTGEGHYSYIGTVSNLIPLSDQTMALDTQDLGNNNEAWQRTVQHEFGHAIGLLHEHSSPISGIQWKKKKIYDYYAKMGWSKEDVDEQVFATYAVSYTNGTKYDSLSIMHYPIPAWQTKNGFSVDWNSSISENDAALISALYPKKGERKNEVPRFAVSNVGKLEVVQSKTKNGMSFYPAFDISSTGNPGKVYYSVLFLDEDGYSIKDTDGNYAFGSTVAAVSTANFKSGEKASYNKTKKDLEIFIPNSEIHVPKGTHRFTFVFRVVQINAEGEIKYIYEGEPTPYQYTK
jgi:hypothetical protein